jgi:virginiamycin B lyase
MLTWFRQLRRGSARHPGEGRRRRLTLEALEDRCLLSGITEFGTGITAASTPSGITRAADGNLWFTEFGNNAVARITPGGTVTEFPLLTAASGPRGITSGPNGQLYITEFNTGKIASINPLAGLDVAITASRLESAVVPSGAGAGLDGITAGPDGNLWFTEASADRVGNINTTLTTINEFSTGITAGAAPAGIATGPDGALWFTESGLNKIGRITTAGTVSNEFALTGLDPEGITAGNFGTLWFAENGSDQIGRITTGGIVTEFPRLAVGSGPQGITEGPGGAIWFTETTGNRVGRILATGQVTEYTLPTAGSDPLGIVAGPDTNLWFAESTGNKVGKLIPDAFLTATGTPFSATATLSFSGPVASFTDGDATAVPADFAVTINWGDGTPLDTTSGTVAAVAGQPGSFIVTGTHTFATGGTKEAEVTITDTNTTTSVGGSTAMAGATATVAPVATTTTLAASATQLMAGQSVTLTATVVQGMGTTVPTGTVAFLDGTTTLGTGTLDATGKAALTVALPSGVHSITASYGGSATFTGSTTSAVSVTVAPVPLTGDVTADVQVTIGTLTKVKGRTFTETLTLKNTGKAPLQGPLNVVLRGLKANVKVSGAKFFKVKNKKIPFVVINPTGGLLQPGNTVSITLTFINKPNAFTVSVFANTQPM